MISRKKRVRYIKHAIDIAAQHNITIDVTNWEDIWNLLDRFKEPTYIYCIKGAGLEYKFGKSVNPGFRLKTLQTGYAYPLTMIAYCPEDDVFNEKSVHKELQDFRIKGEWFKWSPEVQNVIDRIKNHYLPQ